MTLKPYPLNRPFQTRLEHTRLRYVTAQVIDPDSAEFPCFAELQNSLNFLETSFFSPLRFTSYAFFISSTPVNYSPMISQLVMALSSSLLFTTSLAAPLRTLKSRSSTCSPQPNPPITTEISPLVDRDYVWTMFANDAGVTQNVSIVSSTPLCSSRLC